ncbi:MAG: DUF3137 domain-containing protein [Saprospiraceae bacterium]|nr:DUF3137 domain-containing protein [Saprospiraceae bacterium]
MLPYKDFKDQHPMVVDEAKTLRLEIIKRGIYNQNWHTIFRSIGCIIPASFVGIIILFQIPTVITLVLSIVIGTTAIALNWQTKSIILNDSSVDLSSQLFSEPTAVNQEYTRELESTLIPRILDIHPADVVWQAPPSLNLDEMRKVGLHFLFTSYFYDYDFICHHSFLHQTPGNKRNRLTSSLHFLDFGLQNYFHFSGFAIVYKHNFKIKGYTTLVSKYLELEKYFGQNPKRERFDFDNLDNTTLKHYANILNHFTAYTNKLSHAYKVLSPNLFQILSMFEPSEWEQMLVFFNQDTILFFVHNGLSSPLMLNVNIPLITEEQYDRFNRCLQLFDDISQKLTILD